MLFRSYDVDVYIHTWASPESKDYVKLYKSHYHIIEKMHFNRDANASFTRTPNAIKHPPINTYAMLASMYACGFLLDTMTDCDYDWFIKSRSDYALNVVIPFEQLDNTKLYIPNCRMVPERDFGNDQFAFGSQETMSK